MIEKPRSTRCALYLRVSTDQQLNGVSLEAQESALRALAARRGWEIGGVFSDALSGKDTRRPGFRALMEGVRSEAFGAVLVFKLDRLTRSLRDLVDLTADLEEHGVSLVSESEAFDTDSASGRAMLGMLGVFAEYERAMVSARTKAALAHVRKTRRLGRPPFGWDNVGGRLVRDASEQRVLRRILAWRRRGASAETIAAALNFRKIPPRRGRRWHETQVQRILRREEAGR